jgi:hypothetical protein
MWRVGGRLLDGGWAMEILHAMVIVKQRNDYSKRKPGSLKGLHVPRRAKLFGVLTFSTCRSLGCRGGVCRRSRLVDLWCWGY